jgi:hypothetical protein
VNRREPRATGRRESQQRPASIGLICATLQKSRLDSACNEAAGARLIHAEGGGDAPDARGAARLFLALNGVQDLDDNNVAARSASQGAPRLPPADGDHGAFDDDFGRLHMLDYKYMLNDMRPIGYWLKHLDALIESSFERTLVSDGLTRRHWQILNLLADRAADRAAVHDTLKPFRISTEINDLLARGWLTAPDDALLELSVVGRQAHADLLVQVRATRERMVHGVSDAEYLGTLSALQRMARNLAD